MNSFTIKAIKARFLQKFLGKPLEIKKSWEDTPADFHKMVDFLNWFDRTDSIEDCLKKAESDWKHRFASHAYFGSLPKNTETVPNSSIDLIYSFIVFQHFDKMSEVDFYLSHIERVLSNHGVAHIYFGKNPKDGVKTVSENDFRLRDCSLFISPEIMREKISQTFDILSWEDKLPRDPVTNSGESVQAMIVFRRK